VIKCYFLFLIKYKNNTIKIDQKLPQDFAKLTVKVDIKEFLFYNKFMNTNFEIYNYLNLINRRVGKIYRTSGKNPLPSDFVVDKQAIKDRLIDNQFESTLSFPVFLYEDKKSVKKRFSSSIKQLKQLKTILHHKSFNQNLSKKFATRFECYLNIRIFVTKSILKDFKKYYFNECDAYEEICAIDTIFFDLLDGMFEPDIDVRNYLDNLEEKYNIYYQARVKRLEEKVSKETSEKRAKQNAEINLNVKNLKEDSKKMKSEIKNEKKTEKLNKDREIFSFKQEKEQN
jgi:hypothetical protein